MTYNSRLAQELGFWAEEQGCGHQFHIAAFKAYFAEGRNIAHTDVLVDLANQCGLSSSSAKEVLVRRQYRKQVDRDWELSRRMQITAAPTFVLGETRLVGAQSYRTLQDLMEQNGVMER